jgi:hypothetical protein
MVEQEQGIPMKRKKADVAAKKVLQLLHVSTRNSDLLTCE